MTFSEFSKRNLGKIFIITILLFVPITITLGRILFPFSLFPSLVELLNSLKEPYINWVIWIYSLILAGLISFSGLFYIEKYDFLRFEWKKIFLTIVLFFATNLHLVVCMVFETYGRMNPGRYYPCGVVSQIEYSIISKFGNIFNFDLFLIFGLYLFSCLIIYTVKRLRKTN